MAWNKLIQTNPSYRRCKPVIAASMSTAMDMATGEVAAIREPAVVVVTGSFYAVSDALKWVDKEREMLL